MSLTNPTCVTLFLYWIDRTVNEEDKNASPAAPPQRHPWVTRAEAATVLVLAAIFLVAVLVIVIRQHRAGARIEVIRAEAAGAEYRIDLNTAGVQELMLLPGIGEVRSQRLVDWREANGRIASLEDIREATGLSASSVEKLREFIIWPAESAETRETP